MTRSLYLERIERFYGYFAVRLVTIVLARSFGTTYAHLGRGLGLSHERVKQLDRLAHVCARRKWPKFTNGPPRDA